MNKGSIVVIIAVAIFSTTVSYAELNSGEYKSKQWKVRLNTPNRWRASEYSSYPGILLWVTHPNNKARILFSAERLTTKILYAKINTQTYAFDTAKRLKHLGFSVRAPQLHSATGAFWIDFDDGKHFLRQAVLVPDNIGIGYSLTLSASDRLLRAQLLRVFDYVLRSIKLDRHS